MSLKVYQQLRNFKKTSEPRGKIAKRNAQRFVVQEHHASQLHYDFRLEIGGVAKSWAVPKGPSLDPRQKHLAVQVEDHPIDYLHFQGEIEPGNYGAGKVIVWDSGTFEPLDSRDLRRAHANGKLGVILHGKKLRGQFNLVRMKNSDDQWLLIKSNDEYADRDWKLEPILKEIKPPTSMRARTTRRAKKTVRPARAKSKTRPITSARKETLSLKTDAVQIAIPDLERAPMPQSIRPMLATLVDKPFSDPDWLFENKWDGVRAICFFDQGQTRLFSRNGKEMTLRYPELASIGKDIHASRAILDGEIVVLNEKGQPSFQLLQSRVGLESQSDIQRRAQQQRLVYYIFDLLYFDGFDLMPAPLIERKKLLQAIVEPSEHAQISDYVVEKGEELFERAKANNQEGIIAKFMSSPYVEGRSGRWLKLKTTLQEEVVIGGYTKPRNTREYFGALVVGLYRDGKLVSVGHVGGGFNRASLKQLYDQMQPLKTRKSPFAIEPGTNEPVQWVKPALVCEVKFAEWTRDQQMRQPVFLGLRDDKAPAECTFERARPAQDAIRRTETISKPTRSVPPELSAGSVSLDEFVQAKEVDQVQVAVDDVVVALTHLDNPYFPGNGITKGDLLKYYAQVAPTMLPYLRHRPLILKRYPRGINAPFFYQHDLASAPEFVRRQSLRTDTGRVIDYAIIDNTATLLYLANLGTIEVHPWHSRVEDVKHPDWMILDLDPVGADYETVCQVAQAIRETLEQFNLRGYPKTTGSRGIHIFVPIEPRYDYERVVRLAQHVAVIVGNGHPDIVTLARAAARRSAGRVYIDYGQNAKGKSIAAAYSVRARAGATVSAPLAWDEIKPGLQLQQFTLENMPARIRDRGDLFRGVLEHPQNLDDALKEMARQNKSLKTK